jgi:hypothetical protein
MKNSVLKSVALGALLLCAVAGVAQAAAVTVTVNGADPYQGYMNVSELPSNGGAFQFGSPWGTADLTAVFAGNVLTLGPNTIGDPNPYWYTPAGGPGAAGNKIMEANMYVEQTGPLANTTLTFDGTVISNTLTAAHVAHVFIRDFAPDFSSVVETSILLPASGSFSITQATINDPARHVQYGFQVKGVDVWATDTAPYGTAVVGPLQATPTTKTTWGGLKALYR